MQFGWVNMRAYNFFVCGPMFTIFFSPKVEGVVVDQLLFRFLAEFKQSVIDKAIGQWRPRLKACVRASGQHFEQLIN